MESELGQYDLVEVERKVEEIYSRVLYVLKNAEMLDASPLKSADFMAEKILRAAKLSKSPKN